MANIIDSNLTSVRYKKQASVGENVQGTKFTETRVLNESINGNRSFVTSQELRSDRMTADSVAVSEETSGDVGIEWSYASFDDFIEGAMQSDWETISFTGTVTGSAQTISGTGFPTLVSGQWVAISGFDVASDDGLYRVDTADSTDITFNARIVAGADSEDETAWTVGGGTVSINGKRIKNGTSKKYYAVVVDFEKADGSHIQKVNLDGEVSTMSLEANIGAILTGTFGFMFRKNQESTGYDDGAPTATNNNDVLNAVNNLGSLRLNGAKYDDGMLSFNLSLNNNLAVQQQLGSFEAAGVRSGTLSVDGSFQAYFGGGAQSTALNNAYKNSNGVELEFAFKDNDGNHMVVRLPRVKLTGVTKSTPGGNADIVMEGNWVATRDATLDSMIEIYTAPAV